MCTASRRALLTEVRHFTTVTSLEHIMAVQLQQAHNHLKKRSRNGMTEYFSEKVSVYVCVSMWGREEGHIRIPIPCSPVHRYGL